MQWQVAVAGGKYRLVMGDDGVLRAWRNNQPWPARDLAGDNLVLALAQELREARAEADALLDLCEEALRRLEAMPGKPQQMNMATADKLRATIRKAGGSL